MIRRSPASALIAAVNCDAGSAASRPSCLTVSSPGAIAGPIYDVINAKGEVIDRVQVPPGRQIIGFGKGGVVYLQARDDKGSWIERTHR